MVGYMDVLESFREKRTTAQEIGSQAGADQEQNTSGHEINEINERSELMFVTAHPEAYDDKATIAGGIPPMQKVIERLAWLDTIDWSIGMRCGLSGQRCKVCKGAPCRDSTEWA